MKISLYAVSNPRNAARADYIASIKSALNYACYEANEWGRSGDTQKFRQYDDQAQSLRRILVSMGELPATAL